MVRVGICGNIRVVENRRGFIETYMMFLRIAFRFFVVPFKFGIFRENLPMKL